MNKETEDVGRTYAWLNSPVGRGVATLCTAEQANVMRRFSVLSMLDSPLVLNARPCVIWSLSSIGPIPFAVRMASRWAMLGCSILMNARGAPGRARNCVCNVGVRDCFLETMCGLVG